MLDTSTKVVLAACVQRPLVILRRVLGLPPTLVADPRLAQRELGWTPAFRNIDEIVATAWAWHQRASGAGAPERLRAVAS